MSNLSETSTSQRQLEDKSSPSSSQGASSSDVTPNPLASNNSIDHNTADFKQCTDHKNYLKDLFCQSCGLLLCDDCSSSHVDHSLLKLQDEKENLTSFLHKREKQATEAERRHTEILRHIVFFENSTSEAQKQMDDQYEFIKKELQMIYNGATKELERFKGDQLQKLRKEASDLQEIGNDWKFVKEYGTSLLRQVATVTFIRNAKVFMQNNPEKLLKTEELFLKTLQYRPPTVTAENLQEYILGSFIDPASESESFGSSFQSSLSISGNRNENGSARSHLSFGERLSESEGPNGGFSNRTLRTSQWTIERVSEISREQFKLELFFNGFFQGNTMWVCGLSRTFFGNKATSLLNLDLSDNNVQKTGDFKADYPTIMFSHENIIVFAKRGGNEIFRFNTQTHKVKQLARFDNLAIVAMCGTEEVYYLDSKSPDYIRILKPSRPTRRIIPTGLKGVKDFGVTMCLITGSISFPASTDSRTDSPDHTIILCVSMPHASVRAVNQSGILWQLDCRSHPDQLGLDFNPCSVSSAITGDIFIADRETGIIYMVSSDGKDLHILLGKETGINNPTLVCVNGEGNKLLVINRDGSEIKNYSLKAVRTPSIDSRRTSVSSVASSTPSQLKQSLDTQDQFGAKLWELSQKFTESHDLRDFALKRLKMNDDTVERHIKKSPNDITSAAYTLFREYVQKYKNKEIAITEIKLALEATDKQFFKESLN